MLHMCKIENLVWPRTLSYRKSDSTALATLDNMFVVETITEIPIEKALHARSSMRVPTNSSANRSMFPTELCHAHQEARSEVSENIVTKKITFSFGAFKTRF